jgi:hypothetical protein
MNNSSTKQIVATVVSLGVILASSGWIYFTQFASPKINLPLHKAIGEVMAEETSRLLGHKGSVIVLAIDPVAAPELQGQLDAFKQTLRRRAGITIKETEFLDTRNNPKFGAGRGLSGRRFLDVIKKHSTADAIVSFVGAPNLSESDFAELGNTRLPRFIAESGSAAKLRKLFDRKVLNVAIVARYQFPAPAQGTPKTPTEWFQKRFQIVTVENADTLPGPGVQPSLEAAKSTR